MRLTEPVRSEGTIGELVARGDERLLAHVRAELGAACVRGEKRRGVLEWEGTRLYFKFGPLAGKARVRHALRGVVLRQEVPRLREFENLAWLRRNGFHAPRPLAAGVYRRGVLPLFQFLYTQEVPHARTFRQVLEGGPSPRRVPLLRELGLEVARLHRHGFVHRDLFPRNVLVTGFGSDLAVHFLDAWRGGPGPGLRGPSWDVACWMLYAADLCSGEEQAAFLDAYFDERAHLGKPVRTERFLRAVARARRSMARRLDPARLPAGVPRAPGLEWTPPPRPERGGGPPPRAR